ncbi:uncharacterized protein B0I36DRAFT_321953 [Microdochium trichocladiopsis]|uniref:Uncharacterized protein n=1 Tax=Microdochium trichocladiopsis TaxID=1682393 RepID=A0A9P8YA11_9PEZI|nr:uncharacterized protein B0I36DRAFT_321953 [Microdochium trichocladiopsis]KAH7033723.1 hypothetical protein B0I36DRAFT_321953 [Microdochium trichocladiopsis]
MSMATTVIYRAFRDRTRDYEQTLSDLRLCCAVLDSLGLCWTSVHGICNLVRNICPHDSSEDRPELSLIPQVPGGSRSASALVGIDIASANSPGDRAPAHAELQTLNVPEPVSAAHTGAPALLTTGAMDENWASHLDPSSYFLMDPAFHLSFDLDFFTSVAETQIRLDSRQ